MKRDSKTLDKTWQEFLKKSERQIKREKKEQSCPLQSKKLDVEGKIYKPSKKRNKK